MTHQIFKLPKNTQIDSSVRVVPGAKAYFFTTLTSTPQDTYTTAARNVAHAHPVEADANGVLPPIYLDPTLQYKLTLNTSADVLIYTVDPINDLLLSQDVIGEYLYPQTSAENTGGVTDIDYTVPSHDQLGFIRPQRYGFSSAASAAVNTAALEAALAVAAELDGAVCKPGAGTFLIEDFVCDINNFLIEGDGKNLTLWSCAGVSATAFTFSKGASSIVRGGISNCGFIKADSDTKTAVLINDGRQMRVDHLAINLANWPGSASIGLHTKGRDFIEFHDCDIECARPWVIDKNPNHADLHTDLHEISRVQFATTVTTGKCIEVLDGVELTTIKFNTCDFALGKYGIYWNDTTATIGSYQLSFENCRWEQGDDATGYDVYLVSTAQNFQSINFKGCNFDTAKGGVYLRQAERVVFDNCSYAGTSGEVMNVTFISSTRLSMRNCLWNTGSTFTLTNARILLGLPNAPSMNAFGTGEYGYDGNASRNITIGGAVGDTTFTLANDAVQTLGTTTMLGMLTVVVTNADNCFARFNIRGTNNVTAELEDPQTLFSAAAGTANMTNVYWNGGTSRYELENKRGGSRGYRIFFVGVYS